ncbi:hypothetical protein J000_03486 [Cryptococcus neoformans]|nr:hypothetical protein C350_03466 [Cryptococcus neoformans var. grubii MW-RSA36]OXH69678.1 hypothetical protein J000_03486 [Cryptococcus neoformans var. grubii]
MDLKGSMHRRI